MDGSQLIGIKKESKPGIYLNSVHQKLYLTLNYTAFAALLQKYSRSAGVCLHRGNHSHCTPENLSASLTAIKCNKYRLQDLPGEH